ncbi:MAG: hypothetical protein WBD47_03945 [Phormidesmis sp.]
MDALLLTVYFLVVIYVLYQMALALEDRLEDKIEIIVEEKTLGEQTNAQLSLQRNAKHINAYVRHMSFGKGKDKKQDKKKQIKRPVLVLIFNEDQEIPLTEAHEALQKEMKLDDEQFQEFLHPKIIVRIAPTNEQKLKPPIVYLSIYIHNDTDNTLVYIDWDRSSLEMFGQGNRLIRSTPNVPIDLSRPQIFTAVNPGMIVGCDTTIEKKYNFNPEANQVQLPQPLVDLEERVELFRMTDPTTEEENIQPLYTLDLMMGIKRRTDPDSQVINLLIPFIFKMKIKVDKPAFPPLRWLLRNFGRRKRSKGSWFWGSKPKKNGSKS